jgi:hypothetical protein
MQKLKEPDKEICGPHDLLTSPREIISVGILEINAYKKITPTLLWNMAGVRISKAGARVASLNLIFRYPSRKTGNVCSG